MSSTAEVPRARRRSAAQRQHELFEEARAIALQEGLSAISLRTIARRAGVTSALVAHYAPVMDEFVAAVFTRIVGDELLEVQGLAQQASATTRLEVIVRALLDGGREDVTAVWVEAWALGRRNEALGTAVRQQMDEWQHLLEKVIDDSAAAGAIAATDTSAAAWLILGMIDGLSAQSLVRWGDSARRSELLLTTIRHGLLSLES